MSANDNIGPHLLGRVPSTPDERDYKLVHFLSDDPLDAALAALLGSWEGKKTKAWAKLITERVKAFAPAPTPPNPTPTPTPPPTPTDVTWVDSDVVLDQGQTPHCVGFGWCGWGDTLPVDDHFVDADGHKVYYECKAIDGEPGAEDGSQVRSGAKAMQTRKRLSAYAFAANLGDVRAWLAKHGSVVFGTDWTNDMFTPNANGYIKPTGSVEGGHCYIAVGDLVSEGAILFQNSWGASWGLAGRFKMKYADVASLIAQQGEACASVELP